MTTVIADGGYGDAGICTITPSNQIAGIDNILSRLDRIESVLSRMLGTDVTALEIDDLVPDGGITNALAVSMLPECVTEQYTGSAWITAAGTIAGITFCDSYWENLYGGSGGTLPIGSVSSGGIKVDLFNNATEITYSTTPSTVRPFTVLVPLDLDGVVSAAGSGKISFNATGLYMLSYVISVEYPVAAGSNKIFRHGFGDGSGWYGNLSKTSEMTGQSGQYYPGGCFVARIANIVADYVYLQVADNGTASGTRTCNLTNLAITRLKGL